MRGGSQCGAIDTNTEAPATKGSGRQRPHVGVSESDYTGDDRC